MDRDKIVFELQKTYEAMWPMSRSLLEKDGKLTPVLFALTPRGIQIVGLVFDSYETKRAAYRRVKQAVEREASMTKTVTVEIEAGLLVRSRIRRWLARQQCANRLVRVNWREDRGWLDSQFLIDISGDPLAVGAWRLAARDMIERWAGDGQDQAIPQH